jgi:hypothetical protein
MKTSAPFTQFLRLAPASPGAQKPFKADARVDKIFNAGLLPARAEFPPAISAA